MSNAASIRPSALPKLAECPSFQSAPGTSPAAERGTKIDAALRAYLGGNEAVFGDLKSDEADAVRWAADRIKALSGGTSLQFCEGQCKLHIPGIKNPGTADVICREKRQVFDLKSGSIRNYREQMAAYALALMEDEFADSWTAYVVFCDQKEVVELEFTLQEARAIVLRVIVAASAENPERKECEYCSWCSLKDTCPVQVEKAKAALAVVESPAVTQGVFDAILSDSAKLGEFLSRCADLDKLRERAEERAKEMLAENPLSVPGWKLRRGAEPEVVDPDVVGRFLSKLGHAHILSAYGTMTAKKFRDVWEKQVPTEPFPEGITRKKPANKPSLIKA